MKRKTLVFTIVALFLLTSLSSVYAEFNKLTEFPSAKPTDWNIIVPDDYPTIQEAVDHAQEYNTIMVRSGIYEENVIVDVNALQIIGEDLTTTIIDGDESEIVLEIKAFLVSISGLNITSGEIGLSFGDFSPTFNNIYGNTFYKNQIGIEIKGAARSNIIYHNNFIDNYQNAYDPTENILWFDSEIKQGNYWDDYTGKDNDGDGIGDTPYDIPGNRAQDEYPLMEPYCYNCQPTKPSKPLGSLRGKVNQKYNYTSSAVDPKGAKLYYWFDWGDGTNSSWIGPFDSGEECKVSHIWIKKGSFEIRVKAKNEYGAESIWSDPLAVSMPRNKQLINHFIQLLDENMSHSVILRKTLDIIKQGIICTMV